MKNLKLMLGGLLLLASLSACKKDKADSDDPNNPAVQITKSDLAPYYIVAERKTGDQKLVVISFTQEGTSLKTNVHRQGYLRVVEGSINNNALTFDIDGNGNYVYNFLLEKNASGQLVLKTYQYTDKASAAQGFDYAVLVGPNSAQAYENASFKSNALLFKFSDTKTIDWDIKERQIGTKFYPPPINQTLPIMATVPEVSIPYYSIAGGAFKANNDFIGAMVPNWKATTTPAIIVERNNTFYLGLKQ